MTTLSSTSSTSSSFLQQSPPTLSPERERTLAKRPKSSSAAVEKESDRTMTGTSTTPPPIQGPTAKEKKYDRQLRLWAAAGQQALEEAHVLLLNEGAGTVGVEMLKNLVLPGIGKFTIVDANVVKEEDLGVNFFLEESSLGKSRAKECCRLLKELNPDVQGHGIHTAPADYVKDSSVLQQYTSILITSPTSLPRTLEVVARYAWKHQISLFFIISNGFYSQFSLQVPAQFPIVDTHPDPTSTQDLRLLTPWPELSAFARVKTAKLETLTDHEHGHIPYLLLLLHYLEEWKNTHDEKAPENYREKTSFREIVSKGIRRDNPEGGEENFDEAVGAVLKSLNLPTISSGLKEVFEAEQCVNIYAESARFWVIAHAIRDFHETHKVLPLPGALPDMKSQSADYIQLQNIYKQKARKDLAEVAARVREIEVNNLRETPINEKEIEAFCKGAAFVKLVKGRRLRIPLSPTMQEDWSGRAEFIIQQLEDEDSLIPIFIAIYLYQHFSESHISKDPSSLEKDYEIAMSASMDQFLSSVLTEARNAGNSAEFDIPAAKARIEPVIQELGRSRDGELHNISALTGGMVAQEVIKVITKQYIPVDNTCVFDGISSRAQVFRI